MKFKNINYKKTFLVLIASIVLVNSSGCSKNNTTTYESPSVIPTPSPTMTPTPTPAPTPTMTPTPTTNQKLIDFLNEVEAEVDDIIVNSKDSLEYAKALFVTLVDFIFLGEELENIKFDDLTEQEKQQVLQITTSIDNKLENKFPNYKDKISETGSNISNKTSELIQKGAENIKNFTKENLGEDFYNSWLETKEDIKYHSKEAWNFVKDFTTSSFEQGKQYIKDWYNEIK